MGIFDKLFGKSKKEEISKKESADNQEPIQFWQILPFDIFQMPDDSYEITKKAEKTKMVNGDMVDAYYATKQSKSVHPWMYDTIKVHYSDSEIGGKTVNLLKDVNSTTLDRLTSYINWLSSIYGIDDYENMTLTADENYEFEDSLNNPEGFWFGRSWMNNESKPKCSINLNEDGTKLITVFWFEPIKKA